MNQVTISGKVNAEPRESINSTTGLRCVTFTLKNYLINANTGTSTVCYVRCVGYGKVASYIWEELYIGCSVVVTGRLANSSIPIKSNRIHMVSVICNTVSRLYQEEYD